MRILFWNLKRKDLTEQICQMVRSEEIDVVILNEYIVSSDIILRGLRNISSEFVYVNAINKRFLCFARSGNYSLAELHKGNRTSFRLLKLGGESLLLGLVHGVDIRNYDSESRQSFAEELGSEVRFVSDLKKNNRVILIGDFNMNPYDRGMTLARGLNAMSTRACVLAKQRKHNQREYDFYYNPMWSLFGDDTDGPAGTVYDTSNQGPYGWSMLDQVVVNYSIVDIFLSVKILTKAGDETLITNKGRPKRIKFSDHLPIQLTLKG